ncbi:MULTISPECIES: hypothetical protein [Alphaproteobacteria]|uniref:Biotin transporter BioY n=2 Tax=Alphaproteobacteria TaxID=28211 RepID=A0A512HDN3_9HYPH|nr:MULTISPECIES: hypothetical protein [Alphaproteobacteria]GEO83564.1 hypothetical protein RNA01_04960 [Ciceribacter naphthalenivorans]GLR24284.1 hypothetical protein GCM10007920_40780 [Ciceribacter naphthalenivorans]GLT07140.1 hypothetical protein GCM10007926_40780 [Sphingomonas psychrolutea]
MNGLETAIRNALERSDRTNAETRARIYQSARQALESGMRKQGINDPEAVAHQRHRLETLIHAIEQEERAYLDRDVAPVEAPGPVSTETTSDAGPVPDVTPPVVPSSRTAPYLGDDGHVPAPLSEGGERLTASRHDRVTPTAARPDGHPRGEEVDHALEIRAETPMRPRKPRRGLYSRIFVFVILFASLGAGAWWIYSTGMLLSASERDTSVPNPPPRAEAEDFTGSEQTAREPRDPAAEATAEPRTLDSLSGFSDSWIEVFEPKQISAVRPHANALVDVISASDGTALQIVSRSADSDGSVEIAVPSEVLREMAGRASTIALTLQSADEKPVQISVSCDFGRLGDCARHRFTANPEKSDALFRVSFERAMAPGTPGRLLLNGDLGGTGRGVNLYSVRILPGE